MKKSKNAPLVSIVMGSSSDYATMKNAEDVLKEFGVSCEAKVVSAHRTPKLLYQFATEAKSQGIKIIIAGAGGAAHLPGMIAAITDLPVLGVPVISKKLAGLDSLLSIAQMPYGVPVGCLSIGEDGAKNAGLLAVSILALHDEDLSEKLLKFRKEQEEKVLKSNAQIR